MRRYERKRCLCWRSKRRSEKTRSTSSSETAAALYAARYEGEQSEEKEEHAAAHWLYSLLLAAALPRPGAGVQAVSPSGALPAAASSIFCAAKRLRASGAETTPACALADERQRMRFALSSSAARGETGAVAHTCCGGSLFCRGALQRHGMEDGRAWGDDNICWKIA
jgi:hypothetical protein